MPTHSAEIRVKPGGKKERAMKNFYSFTNAAKKKNSDVEM